MQKGIVFEINNGKATVMKNNGEFIRIAAPPEWKKGDVVTIKAKTVKWKAFSLIAASFLLLVSASAFGMGIYFDETVLISLDVNPSIELSVNQFDRVIDVRSLNEEGYDILEQVNVKNKLYDNAISALFTAGLGDYISQNPLVTFTIFSLERQSEQLILKKVHDTANTYITSHHTNAQIEVLCVDESLVNEAHSYNITAGKYAALRELQEVLPEMEIESYTHHSISYIKDQMKNHDDGHDTPTATEQNTPSADTDEHDSIKGHSSSHN